MRLERWIVGLLAVLLCFFNEADGLFDSVRDRVAKGASYVLEKFGQLMGFWEGCEDKWIPENIAGLKADLLKNVFGQDLAVGTVLAALNHHYSERPVYISNGCYLQQFNSFTTLLVGHSHSRTLNMKILNKLMSEGLQDIQSQKGGKLHLPFSVVSCVLFLWNMFWRLDAIFRLSDCGLSQYNSQAEDGVQALKHVPQEQDAGDDGKWSRDKPLVLSFHGMPGTGKNYIAEFILKNMFKEGSRSQFAHFYSAHLDFPDSMEKHTYQKKLEQEIEASIYKCHRSIFVFDEVEKMPNGLLEVLSPYAEGWKNVDGIDYKKVVFIFLSNTAQLYIRDVLNYHHKNGKLRDELKMRHFKDLPRLAFRDKGGLHRTTLISSDLISQYVPFLPIDACHAEKCIVHEINKINQTVSYNLIQEVLSNMHFEGRFSSGGCKLIDAIVLREVFMQSLKLTGVH